ncbi:MULTISPECIES: hypothetical protein [Calothrix]
MPNAQCPMPHAQCPMPHAQYLMPLSEIHKCASVFTNIRFLS